MRMRIAKAKEAGMVIAQTRRGPRSFSRSQRSCQGWSSRADCRWGGNKREAGQELAGALGPSFVFPFGVFRGFIIIFLELEDGSE
jgi:hypothetical protein